MAELVAEAGVASGKYLTFVLAEEVYGIGILRVQEIVGLLPVTRIPRLPDSIAGVVNLRGRVIPVIDLRLAFNMPGAPRTEVSCIIVVRIEAGDGAERVLGVIVDEVSDVAAFPADRIEATPEFGADVNTDFIQGVGRLDDRVVLLLDIDKALSVDQMTAVNQVMTEASGAFSEDAEGEGDV